MEYTSRCVPHFGVAGQVLGSMAFFVFGQVPISDPETDLEKCVLIATKGLSRGDGCVGAMGGQREKGGSHVLGPREPGRWCSGGEGAFS